MKKNNTKSILISIATWAVICVTIPYFFKYTVYSTVGIEYWANYESVEPVKPSFKIGETLIFESTSTKYRPALIEWSDVLYCDVDGDELGFIYFSNYESSGVIDPSQPSHSNGWAWRDEAPESPATCYLRAGITIRPTQNIKKIQIIDSAKFRIE